MPTTPFVKWAGGKRRLLPTVKAHLPPKYEGFLEPFVGGGALFFDVEPPCALIADANGRLIRAYRAVRDSIQDVIQHLGGFKNDQTTYLAVRDSGSLDSSDEAEAAATFIYLNKTGFNGLYRVNASGRFNVPFGHNPRAHVCDIPTLRACSAALQGTSIEHAPFEDTLAKAQAGDFVYCDPPYLPAKATTFVGYTAGRFGVGDHTRLRDVAVEAKRRGVQVLISNADTPEVRALYPKPSFRLIPIQGPRSIAASATRRVAASELLIANY